VMASIVEWQLKNDYSWTISQYLDGLLVDKVPNEQMFAERSVARCEKRLL